MKKIFLSAATLTVAFAFGQKKEIAAAVKAIESGDAATANTQIAQAENMMGGKTYLLEPAILEQYYYAKGLSLLKSGKTEEGASYLGKINELSKNKIYSGKDSSKNKVYYVGKEAADQSGLTDLKESTYIPTLTSKLGVSLNPAIEKANAKGLELYNAKKYAEAAPKFQEVYNLLNAAGQDDKKYLYYAGLNYALAEKRNEAIEIYMNLINSGYTGVETTYTAKNKKSGEVENLEKVTWDTLKKIGVAGDYEDFKTVISKSMEQEFYETTATLFIEADRAEEGLNIIEKGLKKFPGSAKLAELQGTAYYKSGKTNEFVNTLKEQLAKNPSDARNWYNLGVVQSKDPATQADALASYKKAVELKPDMIDAWQNLTYLTMGEDSKAIDDYNAARKAGKTELANKIIEARRARLAATLPYAEKWYENDSNNIDVVSLLKGLYLSAKNEAKHKEFKAKESAMSGGK